MNRLRILHTVESYYPEVHGMAEVVRRLSTAMAAKGHEVHIAARVHPHRPDGVYHGVHVHGFDVSGSMVWGIKGADIDRYRSFVMEGGFDVVTCFAAQQWATDLLLDSLNDIPASKVHVPTGFSGLFRQEYKEYFQKMKHWAHQFHTHIVLSDSYRDAVFLKEQNVQSVVLIPNGASEEEFAAKQSFAVRQALGIPSHHALLLHVGSFTGYKGHKELLQLIDRLKTKSVTLLMVCNNAEDLTKHYPFKLGGIKQKWLQLVGDKAIHAHTLSREQTVDAFKQADLLVFPSNIECSPIVLFESMAAHTPFVSSEAGNAAEIIQWSGGGMLLQGSCDANGYTRIDINASAKMIDSILSDKPLRMKLADAGHAAWKRKFTWEAIAAQYEQVYQSLMKH